MDRAGARLDAKRRAHRHGAGPRGDLPWCLRSGARRRSGGGAGARFSMGSPRGSRLSPGSRCSRDSIRSGFRPMRSAGSSSASRSSAGSPIRSTTPAPSAPSPPWRCRCCSRRAPRRGRLPVRLLAAAAFPVAGLAFYLSSSGTATLVVVAGLVVFFLLAPDRLPKLVTLAIGAAGTAILGYAVNQRAALDRGLPTPEAKSQGERGAAHPDRRLRGGGALPVRRLARGAPRPPSSLAAALAAHRRSGDCGGDRDRPADRRRRRRSGRGQGALGRLQEPRGVQRRPPAGRARSSTRAGAGATSSGSPPSTPIRPSPFHGIGPGTWEFWWAQHGRYAAFVRDAHSLYLETLAELGIVGFVLVTGLVLAILGIGTVRAVRAPPDLRLGLAAATAGCAAFAVAAGARLHLGDRRDADQPSSCSPPWRWTGRGARFRSRGRRREQRRREIGWWAGTVVASVAALIVIWLPYRGASDVRASERDVNQGRLDAALSEARSAADAQPYAATPRLQEALVLERQGKLNQAAAAARQATAEGEHQLAHLADPLADRGGAGPGEGLSRCLPHGTATQPALRCSHPVRPIPDEP